MGIDHMSLSHTTRAVIGASLLATAAPVRAAPADYRFEVAQVQPAGPGVSDVTLRLVHVPDSKPVPGAVIFRSTADMGPDGMPTMTAPVKTRRDSLPGLYIFHIEQGSPGNWELKLAAKVQGEAETVRATLPVKLGK